MAVAITLAEYLSSKSINYDVISHRTTHSSLDSARAAHVPANKVSKAVMLVSENGNYLMASVQANRKVNLSEVDKQMGEHFRLVNEATLTELFPDCKPGAIPAVGTPYRVKMMVDDELLQADEIFLEAGDHQHLVRISHEDYEKLTSQIPRADIGGAVRGIDKVTQRHDSELLSEMLVYR